MTTISTIALLLLVAVCSSRASVIMDMDQDFGKPFNAMDFADILSNGFEESEDEDSSDDEDKLNIPVKADPTPCCLPKTWQGKVKAWIGETSTGRHKKGEAEENNESDKLNVDKSKPGKKHLKYKSRSGKLVSSILTLFIDGENHKMAGKAFNPTCIGGKEKYGFIVNFNGAQPGAKLYVFNPDGTKCWVKDYKKAQDKPVCIPPKSTYEGQFSLGALSGGLTVQSWKFGYRNGEGGYFGNFLVTPGTCLPIIYRNAGVSKCKKESADQSDKNRDNESENDKRLLFSSSSEEKKKKHHGEHKKYNCGGKKFVGSLFYYDLQLTISDPTVFNLPASCKSNPIQDLSSMPSLDQLDGILEGFSNEDE